MPLALSFEVYVVFSQKALHPRYAEKFHCIGSACEDTCCRSWQVPIDRQTFEKYRALPNSALTSIFDTNLVLRIHPAPAVAPPAQDRALTSPEAADRSAVTPNPAPAPATSPKHPVFGSVHPDAYYGQITMLPSGSCPFLSTESMCRIQIELGKDHLSHVCDTFPRVSRTIVSRTIASRTIASRTETSLLLSCPEAARQVLLDRRFMHMPRTAPAGHARYTPFLHIAAHLESPNGDPAQYLMEIRQLLFLIVKDRSYPLWQRLFIIGLFSKRLTDVLTDIQADASGPDRAPKVRETVPVLLHAYAELMQQSRLRSTMDAIPADPETHLSIVLKLLDARGSIGPIPHRLLECFQAFMAGIGFDPNLEWPRICDVYRVVYTTRFEAFLVANGHLFENYLLSYMIRNRFPFGDDLLPDLGSTTPRQEFALMAVRYSVINALAAGMAGHHGTAFSAAHVVKLVQSFSKSFEHNLSIRGTMLDMIAEHRLTEMPGIAMLLRV